MTKYIKGKDGKFAGSIGDGKTSVPQTSPGGNIADKLSTIEDKAATPEVNPFLGEFCFGSVVAEPENFDTADNWAECIADAIEDQPMETFRDNFLANAHVTYDADQYFVRLFDGGDDTESLVVYSPKNHVAWVEAFSAETGDFGTSRDLSPEFADTMKKVIKQRHQK